MSRFDVIVRGARVVTEDKVIRADIGVADAKITALMGQFIGVSGQPSTDPQLSLRIITPTDAQEVDESKVNSSVMADIIPPSMLARQAASN